jgi:hypothetical protein
MLLWINSSNDTLERKESMTEQAGTKEESNSVKDNEEEN